MAEFGSIREQLLAFLKNHPNEDVTYTEIESETGLTRDQIKNGLHGLARSNLAGVLERTGGSTWVYKPPATTAYRPAPGAPAATFGYPPGQPSEVVPGWKTLITIVARMDDMYIGVSSNGVFCKIEAIHRLDVMTAESVLELAQHLPVHISNTDNIPLV